MHTCEGTAVGTGRRFGRRTAVGRVAAAAVVLLLAACQQAPSGLSASSQDGRPARTARPQVSVSPDAGAASVVPTRPVRVQVRDGRVGTVRVTPRDTRQAEPLAGRRSADGSSWTSTQQLELATTYTVHVTARNGSRRTTHTSTFRTVTPRGTVRARISPLDGETVGVGMPVAVYFTAPVANRAAVERRLEVETSTPVDGSWYWMDDEEVHYRPRTYWPAGTKVTLRVPLDGVHAGDSVFGDQDRVVEFEVGDRVVSTVDVRTHLMTVRRNGEVLRTLPVTTGKAGFLTRGGTKVVLGKERSKTMDASTIGIDKDDPEYYRLHVEYAVRVTWSGEFLHAAPWSTGSQGSDNVSHGCVGMAPDDAAWFYDLVKRGDVVEVEGSSRPMELRNGYGDWNLSWAQWTRGSALR